MNIDETRRKLQLTEQELADTKRNLKSAQLEIKVFQEQLRARNANDHRIVEMLFPNHELRSRMGQR